MFESISQFTLYFLNTKITFEENFVSSHFSRLLSAGMAWVSSEEYHFLWGLKTHGPHYRSPTEVHLLIPLESTDLRSMKL